MMSLNPIAFGTSGYRGIVGDTFTMAHVREISSAIGLWILAKRVNSVVIGYDPRQGNSVGVDGFPRVAATVLSDMGIAVQLVEKPVPTPLISWFVKTQGVGGGIVFTASHNPPEYNGIKFNSPPGGPASRDVTTAIEGFILNRPDVLVGQSAPIVLVNPIPDFSDFICVYVGGLYQNSSLVPIVVDSRHGTSTDVWRALDGRVGVHVIDILHADSRPDFGGIEPNPTSKEALDDLRLAVIDRDGALGVGHDPDADRHAICDEQGVSVSPEMVAAIVLVDWVNHDIAVDGIVSTVASSAILRAVCHRMGKIYLETAVGFKYFTPAFQVATTRLIGVESSGGFSVSDYLYEKCGFLPAVLVAAISARRELTVSELVNEIDNLVGKFVFLEDKFEFDPNRRNDVVFELEKTDSFLTLEAPESTSTIDGKKWIWSDGSWLLIRLSGTEPVGRIYAESLSKDRTRQLGTAGLYWAAQFR